MQELEHTAWGASIITVWHESRLRNAVELSLRMLDRNSGTPTQACSLPIRLSRTISYIETKFRQLRHRYEAGVTSILTARHEQLISRVDESLNMVG
jgi:hypothetical protein